MIKLNYLLVPLITVIVAFLGGKFSSAGLKSWYQQINLPAWTPPGAVIGLVWTGLYILITISVLLFINNPSRPANYKTIIIIFIVNAILNTAWSYLFFVQHWIFIAFGEAILMDLTIIGLIFLLWPVSKLSSILLIPYALWVAFASFLTFTVWRLNHEKNLKNIGIIIL